MRSPHSALITISWRRDRNAIQGRVITHSPSKDEIYRILSQTHGKDVIVEYMGELPKDLAVMLSIR
jgi:hypothetical protein